MRGGAASRNYRADDVHLEISQARNACDETGCAEVNCRVEGDSFYFEDQHADVTELSRVITAEEGTPTTSQTFVYGKNTAWCRRAEFALRLERT